MSRALASDPWLRTGVSIGIVPLYLLIVHVLAGVVYRALSPELSQTDHVVSAAIWTLIGAIVVAGLAWLLTWRTTEGRPVLHWWIAPVIGVVALVEFVIVIVAIVIPHGEADVSWGAAVLEQIGSPRFWAVSLWMPLTVWICAVATARVRWFRPRRMVLIGVIPFVLAGAAFLAFLSAGMVGAAD